MSGSERPSTARPSSELLDVELCFESDGHLSELSLGFLGDGQDTLLPLQVSLHLDDCAACSERLGQYAHLTFAVGQALAELDGAREAAPLGSRPPARPFPWPAFALALAVAALGLVPRWLDGSSLATRLWTAEREGLGLVRSLRLVVPVALERESATIVALLLTSALLSIGTGWLLARTAPVTHEPLV